MKCVLFRVLFAPYFSGNPLQLPKALASSLPSEVCAAVNTLMLDTYDASEELVLEDVPGLLDAMFDLMDRLNPAVVQVRRLLLLWCCGSVDVVGGEGVLLLLVVVEMVMLRIFVLLLSLLLLCCLLLPHTHFFSLAKYKTHLLLSPTPIKSKRTLPRLPRTMIFSYL